MTIFGYKLESISLTETLAIMYYKKAILFYDDKKYVEAGCHLNIAKRHVNTLGDRCKTEIREQIKSLQDNLVPIFIPVAVVDPENFSRDGRLIGKAMLRLYEFKS